MQEMHVYMNPELDRRNQRQLLFYIVVYLPYRWIESQTDIIPPVTTSTRSLHSGASCRNLLLCNNHGVFLGFEQKQWCVCGWDCVFMCVWGLAKAVLCAMSVCVCGGECTWSDKVQSVCSCTDYLCGILEGFWRRECTLWLVNLILHYTVLKLESQRGCLSWVSDECGSCGSLVSI